MRLSRWTNRFVAAWLGIVFAAAVPGGALAAGDHYGLTETILQVEQTLKRAAATSPGWHSKQDSIQRDIYDITYLLEQALKASQAANHEAMKDYAHHALTLLQRAVNRGHFRADDVAPVLAVIQRFLPNPSV